MPSFSRYFEQPFSTQWRKALVSVPRLVPDSVLHYLSPEGPHPFVFHIPSRGKHTIPLYLFVPPQSADKSQPPAKLPVLIDFHGGGFILGSCQEQAPFCAKMARELNCVAISVDYRLGPYDQYPAANEDSEDVVNAVLFPSKPGYNELRSSINKHLEKNARSPIQLDDQKIAFSGFSSGGNLALNLALSIKDDPTIGAPWPSPLPESFQSSIPILLFYPSLDCRTLPSERPRPEGLNAPKGFFARLELETQLMPTYLPVDKRVHPRASPGLADVSDVLHPKAKMMLVLPQLDTLSDQSGIWVERVKAEGREKDLEVFKVPGVPHGWTQFPDAWLSEGHRKLKMETFEKAREFVRMYWSE